MDTHVTNYYCVYMLWLLLLCDYHTVVISSRSVTYILHNTITITSMFVTVVNKITSKPMHAVLTFHHTNKDALITFLFVIAGCLLHQKSHLISYLVLSIKDIALHYYLGGSYCWVFRFLYQWRRVTSKKGLNSCYDTP